MGIYLFGKTTSGKDYSDQDVRDLRVSSYFGEVRGTHIHNGVDFPLPVGTEIIMPYKGTVSRAYDDRSFGGGYSILILDEIGERMIGIAHLQDIDLPLSLIGKTLDAGTIIGYTGNTGRSTGPHAHVTFRRTPQDDRSDILKQRWSDNPVVTQPVQLIADAITNNGDTPTLQASIISLVLTRIVSSSFGSGRDKKI